MTPRPALLLCVVCLILIVGVVQADTLIKYTTGTEDGVVTMTNDNATYLGARNFVGDGTATASVTNYVYLKAGSTSNHYYLFYRPTYQFNTSTIPDDATITSARVSVVGNGKGNDLLTLANLSITGFTPKTPGTIEASDYNKFKSDRYSTDISYAAFSDSSGTGYSNNFTFNALGLSNISKTGYSTYMLRSSDDVNGAFTGTWSSGKTSFFQIFDSAYSSGVWAPQMTVVYTPYSPDTTPPNSITGLTNTTATTCSSVNWTWTNPTNADYFRLNVYRNGTFWQNLSNTTTFSLWTGLPASTLMTFNSTTEDLSGNRNLTHWANASVTTPACGFAPVANFIANNVTTCKDIPVVFEDTSTNSPTTWHYVMTPGGWDSHFQNFTHAFDTAGLYTVELTAGNAYGSDVETKVDYINVSDCAPIPTPTPTPTPVPPISCFFTNITGATLEPNSSSWVVTSGGITWGMTITNATEGNVSFFNCGGATLKPGGGSGGGEAAGAAFGIIGGIIGGLIVIRRKKP